MANIARHVIANEYSEDLQDNMSNSDGGGRVPSTISEDTREDSPLSTASSGQDHVEQTMVSRVGKLGGVTLHRAV